MTASARCPKSIVDDTGGRGGQSFQRPRAYVSVSLDNCWIKNPAVQRRGIGRAYSRRLIPSHRGELGGPDGLTDQILYSRHQCLGSLVTGGLAKVACRVVIGLGDFHLLSVS